MALWAPLIGVQKHVGLIIRIAQDLQIRGPMKIQSLKVFPPFFFISESYDDPTQQLVTYSLSRRITFVAQKGNMFYSLHETLIVNVYYSETLYCTIKLVLSKLLDVHVFELLSTG